MTDDFVAPLRAAIERADPNWMTQPSHLRRRLEEELGPDSRQHRAQVHQLVVAAEERIPVRLQRNGWSPGERAELTGVLVSTRGWTPEASEWAVVTWAAALDLTLDRPEIPEPKQVRSPVPVEATEAGTWLSSATDVPQHHAVDATFVSAVPEAPVDTDESADDATVIPRSIVPRPGMPTAPTEVPSSLRDAGTDARPSSPVADVSESRLVDRSVSSVPSDRLPRRGMKATTKRAAKFIGEEIDVAYQVLAGPSPAWLLVTLPIGIASFVLPALSGILVMAFILIVLVGRAAWPKRIVAVSGDRVWLLMARGYSPKPRSIIVETTRDRVEFAGGVPPSVTIDGQRLWFLFPITSAARKLPAGPRDDA